MRGEEGQYRSSRGPLLSRQPREDNGTFVYPMMQMRDDSRTKPEFAPREMEVFSQTSEDSFAHINEEK